jgi:hypothetical protein
MYEDWWREKLEHDIGWQTIDDFGPVWGWDWKHIQQNDCVAIFTLTGVSEFYDFWNRANEVSGSKQIKWKLIFYCSQMYNWLIK